MCIKKNEIVKIPLNCVCAKPCAKFLCKSCAICFCYRLSKELLNVEIQWLEVGLNIDLVWYS